MTCLLNVINKANFTVSPQSNDGSMNNNGALGFLDAVGLLLKSCHGHALLEDKRAGLAMKQMGKWQTGEGEEAYVKDCDLEKERMGLVYLCEPLGNYVYIFIL